MNRDEFKKSFIEIYNKNENKNLIGSHIEDAVITYNSKNDIEKLIKINYKKPIHSNLRVELNSNFKLNECYINLVSKDNTRFYNLVTINYIREKVPVNKELPFPDFFNYKTIDINISFYNDYNSLENAIDEINNEEDKKVFLSNFDNTYNIYKRIIENVSHKDLEKLIISCAGETSDCLDSIQYKLAQLGLYYHCENSN